VERRYVRQYENFENLVPEGKDVFPSENNECEISGKKNIDFKLDDIIIIGILIMLLNEEEKDTSTIILLALLFLSEYIL
jgi:hypothetical protein